MPKLGLGPNNGPAFGHEFAESYLRQVSDTLGGLDLDGHAHVPPSRPLPAGLTAPRRAAPLGSMWDTGPADPAGDVLDASGRPLTCMDLSADGSRLVVGGTDHGLVDVDTTAMRARRKLYTKTQGHTEWVSCCRLLADGRIVSGGLDSKICLWTPSGPARCAELLGHTASVAAVEVASDGTTIASASYDKTLRIWDTRAPARGACQCVLAQHTAPVMQLCFRGEVLATGDRSGHVVRWNIATGQGSALRSWHKGHVTALDSDGCHSLVSGGTDGVVRMADSRSESAVVARRRHTGAVNELSMHTLPSGYDVVATAGADGRLTVLEPRKGLESLYTFAHRTFIYSMLSHAHLLLAGDGDGQLIAYDMIRGKCAYGLGANRAAVRCIRATDTMLFAAGDDGSVIKYAFEPRLGSAAPTVHLSQDACQTSSSGEAPTRRTARGGATSRGRPRGGLGPRTSPPPWQA